ncbi:hypothetical protein V5N11_026474 [Cardamine amara subsp. amara]|uniref:Uncharacterized protein n=1 Tax=Cardamine amara subsp. amara TaxID=228776 RepID=A0ABD1B331_CARAN
MLQQILQGQANGALESSQKLAEVNNKLDCNFGELNTKIEHLNNKIKQMESDKAATSYTAHTGQFPGKPLDLPNKFAKAITLRSGKQLQSHEGQPNITGDSETHSRTLEDILRPSTTL